jgi:hypothetical protein
MIAGYPGWIEDDMTPDIAEDLADVSIEVSLA